MPAQAPARKQVDIELEDGVIRHVFHAGCHGNTQGISALVRGMARRRAVARLKGIDCRAAHSCPDQLPKHWKKQATKNKHL